MTTIEMLDELIEETKQKMRALKIRMGILHNNKGMEEARILLDKLSDRLALFEYLKGYETRFEEISKAFEKTKHCCPYDNEKCSKTNCFVNGGDCCRRSKEKPEPSDQDGLNPNQVFIDDWLTAENIETRRQEDGN